MNVFNAITSATFALVLILIIIIIAPLITVASINTILEQASVDAYIPHNFWTYISVYGILIVFKASRSKE